MLGGMNSSEGALLANPPQLGPLRALRLALRRLHPEPLALALLAGTLGCWDLARNGWANTYYSAAVRSMSTSWHNFLFVSLDPSGAMSVDKPPLALWVQALAVKVFGFYPLAMLAPEVLMSVASVLLLYDLTRRMFGRPAGFVGGLVFALTPITVAISRYNNPDALLVLCCVAALWCALRAVEGDRLRWYVLAGVCLGLGFETKMLVALVVLPGTLAAWAWARPLATQRHALWRGPLAALLALVLVGGAWPALVELTPASQRPWVSGTSDNRVLSLIFGYNGLGRVEGQGGGPQALGGSNLFGGSAGPLRLLNSALGGQAGWLLGFALLGGVAILLASRLRRRDPRSGWLLGVGGAFLTTALLFSFARGIFHPYYVSLLAPFAAALVGGGFGQLTGGEAPDAGYAPGEQARRDAATAPTPAPRPALHERRALPALAAVTVAAGIATELAVLHEYPGELTWLAPALIVCGAFAVSLLLIGGPRLRLAVLWSALALLIVAPATWAVETLGHATNGTFPAGGPAGNPAATPGRGGPAPGGAGGAFAGGAPGVAAGVPSAGAIGGPGQPPPAAAGGRGAFNSEGPAARARAGGIALPPRAGGFVPPRAGSVVPPPRALGLNQPSRARGGLQNGTPGLTSQALGRAVRYADAHGGGTVAVSSQSEAATLILDGARVAGIGGFSGRESETTATWLAQEVRSGRIRWVLVDGGFGGPPGATDTRRGASAALSAAAADCRAVSSVSGLYDCAGRAAELAGVARD